jgi:type IV pilus assembly protein PilO
MALNTADLVEKISRTPTKQKVVVLVLMTLIFGAIFYFMFYSDLITKAESIERQTNALRQEKASYEEKKRQYNSFRAEVMKLLEEQKELIKVLPSDSEIPTFLQAVHAQGELAGLNILTFEQLAEQGRNFYAVIPVRMAISGSYHQILKFFYSVGQLKRIVNISNLSLGTPTVTEQGVMLRASFLASTFRFLTPPPQAAPAPGAPPRPKS